MEERKKEEEGRRDCSTSPSEDYINTTPSLKQLTRSSQGKEQGVGTGGEELGSGDRRGGAGEWGQEGRSWGVGTGEDL